jgi:hypothetical protein
MRQPVDSAGRAGAAAAVTLLVVLLAAGAAPAAAQRQMPATGDGDGASEGASTEADRLFNFVATRVDEGPQIDGVLDDPVWSQAVVLTELVQSEPDEGQPVSERTEVRVLYDDRAIYVGAICYDSEPERIVATVLRRDESNDRNDAFMVTLDTYHDHRNGYFFETNPMGARLDAQIVGEGGGGMRGFGSRTFNDDWDEVWESRARITEEGWVVEIAIPFYALRFAEGQSTWGINFRRTIRRKTEKAYWAPIPRNFDHTRLSLSGMLEELQVTVPRNIQVKPFAIGGLNRGLGVGESTAVSEYGNDYVADAGGDVKWGLSANLTLDLTLNTDFSQVEADDEQVNLTRFSLFFPEKRDFFLENAGFFDFGGGGGGGRLGGGSQVVGFHSRNIGIGPDNQEIPLYGGGRLTGKVGSWSVGALAMQSEALAAEDDVARVPSSNYVVGRLSRDLGSRSRAGILFTNRQAAGDDYNREIGVDGRWGINAQTTVDAWVMKTGSPGVEGGDWAAQARFEWSSPLWQVRGGYLDIGESFNPEMGFVTRTGIRFIDPTVFFTPYFPDSRFIRNLSPHVNFFHTTDREGELLSRYLHLDWDTYLRQGDKVSMAYNQRYELLEAPFEIAAGVLIPPGIYEWSETNLELQSDAGRPIDGSFNYTWGGFWSGDRAEMRVQAGWRPAARFNLGLSWTHNDIDLPEGDFTTDLASLRLGLDVTPDMSLGGLIQYNTQSDQVLANLRFRYIYVPGSDLYIVYNERRVAERSDLIDRAVIVKVTRLLRF